MTDSTKASIGVVGAGRLGTAVARQSLKAGYTVRIANSKGPETLKLILSMLVDGAQAATVTDTIQHSDIIVLAIPLSKYRHLSPELFEGKIVIDAMNYWSPTEGHIEEFANGTASSSEYIQKYLPQARVVKTLNHVAYNELEEHSLPKGRPDRRAIALAGDDSEAKMTVTQFINDLGFDAVDLGSLAEGKKFQPDTNLFNARYTADELRALS
jgi:predicted dinucleotide-binding enzyme